MKRRNMDAKYMVSILFASGIVIGIALSAGIGIGAFHASQQQAKTAELEKEAATQEVLKEDPLWLLSEEGVAMVPEIDDTQKNDAGYVFQNKQVKIAVDSPADQILEKLGTPITCQQAGNSLYGKLDKHYQYNGFEVSTYELGDTDYISAIFVDTDQAVTPEGISVSMTRDDMESVYGMEYVEEDGICTYEKDGMGLEFMIDDGKIAYIQYLSSNYM